MGCGCKGNQGSQPAPTAAPPPPQQAKQSSVNESVQSAIKRTIEKYYNQNKGRK